MNAQPAAQKLNRRQLQAIQEEARRAQEEALRRAQEAEQRQEEAAAFELSESLRLTAARDAAKHDIETYGSTEQIKTVREQIKTVREQIKGTQADAAAATGARQARLLRTAQRLEANLEAMLAEHHEYEAAFATATQEYNEFFGVQETNDTQAVIDNYTERCLRTNKISVTEFKKSLDLHWEKLGTCEKLEAKFTPIKLNASHLAHLERQKRNQESGNLCEALFAHAWGLQYDNQRLFDKAYLLNQPFFQRAVNELKPLLPCPTCWHRENQRVKFTSTATKANEMSYRFDFSSAEAIIELKYTSYFFDPKQEYQRQHLLQCLCYSGIAKKPVYLLYAGTGEIIKVQYQQNEFLQF